LTEDATYDVRITPSIDTDNKKLILKVELGEKETYTEWTSFEMSDAQAKQLGIDVTKKVGGDEPKRPTTPSGTIVTSAQDASGATIKFYSSNKYMVTGTAKIAGQSASMTVESIW
jgi:hypothetical protein